MPNAYLGAWTPQAMVLCLPCLKSATSEDSEIDSHGPFTTCDRCGRRIALPDCEDVAHLSNIRHAINARIPGVARMEQTGGMCCAVHVDLVGDARLMLYDDTNHAMGHTCIGLFENKDDEGKTIAEGLTMTESVRRVAVELAKRQILADIEAGRVPESVRGLADLEEHVDANMYGGADVTTDTDPAFWEPVRSSVDYWLSLSFHRMTTPKVGDRVVTTRLLDRYPDFVVQAGETGTVVEIDGDTDDAWVKMDEPIPGAEEWDNKVQFRLYDEAGLMDWMSLRVIR